MNRISVAIFLMIICCFTGILSSCKNKAQELLLKESSMRLEQQNAIAMGNNQMLSNSLNTLMYEDCTGKRIGYLQKDVENFYQRSGHFLSEIEKAKESQSKFTTDNLYKAYTAFQIYYYQLNKHITDKYKDFRLDSNINGFMNLNEKHFIQKYFSATNSANLKIQLQLLEADALLNKSAFLENIINLMTPSWNFDPIAAIATPSNCVYKKGDSLKIISFLAQYVKCFNGYAIIDGQKVESKDGLMTFSKTITESPGIYKMPIKIVYLRPNNGQEIYPAEINYKVE